MVAKKLPVQDLKEILDSSYHSLAVLKGKRIFLTGGTGFFGKWILSAINYANEKKSLNIEVFVLTRNKNKFLKEYPWLSNFEFVEGDLQNFEFPNLGFDYVIHAAADVSTSHVEDGDSFIENAKKGVLRVINFTKKAGAKRIIFTSSGAVYGKTTSEEEESSEEIKLTKELTAYGEAKMLVEKEIFNSGLEYVVLRCFAFIGPELPLNKEYAAGNFLENVLMENNIVIKGDGTPIRSYMYMTESDYILNVGSNEQLSILELAKKIANKSKSIEIDVLSRSMGGPVFKYVPNISKARNNLNLEIKVHLDEAISRTVSWLED